MTTLLKTSTLKLVIMTFKDDTESPVLNVYVNDVPTTFFNLYHEGEKLRVKSAEVDAYTALLEKHELTDAELVIALSVTSIMDRLRLLSTI